MKKSGSKHEGVFQPSYWSDSCSGNLPEIYASDAVEMVTVKSERKKECVLLPIVEPTQPIVENTESKNGRSGSFNFAQNDRCENLSDRTNATVIDGNVPNRRKPMVEGVARRDTAFVSTGQRTAVTEPSIDTQKSRIEKTVFQRRNGSLACPTSENVIIEEIYLLSLNKRAVPMEQKSRRQGIYHHPSPGKTRSNETNGVRGISRCGELLSRCVYYGGSATDLSSLEELGRGEDKARKLCRQSEISGHRSLRKTRSDESNGFGEIRPCGRTWSYRLATTSNASLHGKEGIGQLVNMTDEVRAESEEEKGRHMGREKVSENNSEAACAAEPEQEQEQRRLLQETRDMKEENLVCVVTAETMRRQNQRRRRHGVSEANRIETRDSKEESLACGVTAKSIEKQEQPRRRQRISEGNIEARDACAVNAESVGKHEQRSRRDGVCESVDKTAASRRKAKILRKKLFGEDLPIDFELMIEQTAGRALNKRM